MHVKINDHTPILVIGLIIVLILSHFYNPIENIYKEYDVWATLESNYSGVTLILIKWMMRLLEPVLISFAEVLTYILAAMSSLSNDSFQSSNIIATFLIFLGYVILIFFLESIHIKLHKSEGLLTICVNMICIENIATYMFNLIAFWTYRKIIPNNVPDMFLGLFLMTIGLAALWVMVFYMMYFLVGIVLSMALPMLVLWLCQNWNDTVTGILFVSSLLFSSQIIWRMSSGFLYSKLFGICTFHKIELL